MTLAVIEPGVQTTLQAAPRLGLRHLGVPSAGPADVFSMACANRLVGCKPWSTAIEITNGPAAFAFDTAMSIGLAGARSEIWLDGERVDPYEVIRVHAGARLDIEPFAAGARLYLAVSGEIAAREDFGSASTYLPASLGGHDGRALQRGDGLRVTKISSPSFAMIPQPLRLPLSHSFVLRAVPGPDTLALPDSAFVVTARASRMGLELDGVFPDVTASSERPSSALMPGALQIVPGGRGFLLGVDAQTTGGYPHILQVIRADRHLIGQIRSGDRVRFLMRTQRQAEAELASKQSLMDSWFEDFRL